MIPSAVLLLVDMFAKAMHTVSSTIAAEPSRLSRLADSSSVTVGGVFVMASAYSSTSRSSGVNSSDSRQRGTWLAFCHVQVLVLRLEVVDVEAPTAANLRRDGHVRERLEARGGRMPRAHLRPELQAGLGNLGRVPQHLDGLGHGTELLDHAVAELGGELGLRNA